MACFQCLKRESLSIANVARREIILHEWKEVFPFNFVILIKYSKEPSFKTKIARKSPETERKQYKK